MESRSSSVGESGGTGGYVEDDSCDGRDFDGNLLQGECDACPDCMDVCAFKSTETPLTSHSIFLECVKCEAKRSVIRSYASRNGEFSMCQVRRHTTRNDCWLVAHKRVYDATAFIKYHPAGPRPILSRAGGDCTTDYDFHSLVAHRHYWKPLCIGKVVDCPLRTGGSIFQTGCTIS